MLESVLVCLNKVTYEYRQSDVTESVCVKSVTSKPGH